MRKCPFEPRKVLCIAHGEAQKIEMSAVEAISHRDVSGQTEVYVRVPQELPQMCVFGFTNSTATGVIDVLELAELAKRPCFCSKLAAPGLVSYKSRSRRSGEMKSYPHGAVIICFDDTALSEEQVRDMFGLKGLSVPYLAYTNSDHTEEPPKWTVVIPFAEPVSADVVYIATFGLAHYLGLETESIQARIIWGFKVPNKVAHDAEYFFIDSLGNPKNWLRPEDRRSIFMEVVSKGWSSFLAEQEAQGTYAKVKPDTKNLSTEESGVLDWIENHYSLAELLERNGYFKKDTKLYLPPNNSSCLPGVRIFTDDGGRTTVYSYHVRQDPLSEQLHMGHALSVADALCVLEYEQDFSRMLREETLKKELVKLEASYQKLSTAYFELKSQYI